MDTDNPGPAGGAPEAPVEMPPTHIAVTRDDTDKLAELVRRGESLTDPNTKETVLHAAARAGTKNAVQYILREKLVSPTAVSVGGHSAAHLAALFKHLEVLKLILTYDSSKSSQLAHQQDETGHSLLSLVTLGGSKEMAEWLLDNYPDLGQSTNTNGNMAVHFAAAQGQLGILKMLVERCGKEIAEKADFKQTKPVYFAAQEGQLKVLDYLINELGVDPVARDKAGMCSVHAATQGRHPTTVKWLINKLGTSYILDKTGDGGTPLHMAAARGAVDILKFLLEKLESASDVNVQDSIKATPAHDAAEYGQTQAMILLLKAGADLSIQDMENKTPYQLAVGQDNDPELANLINDYRKGGLPAIAKYEKKRKKTRDEGRGGKDRPRTSHQEAQELSVAIQESNEVVERRNEQNLQRQESLNRINELGLEEYKSGGRGKPRGGPSDEDNDIEHHLGPLGGVYARPKKRGGSKHNSDIEDFIEETMSHKSFSSHRHRSPVGYPRYDEGGYATINHETASNVSRPSRVKRYHDSDSEVSSFAGSAGHFYHSGHYPGVPMGARYPGFPPPLPPPRGSRGGPRSVASSRASGYSGQRMALPPGYPGYHPGMMQPPAGAYYGWPGFHPGPYGMPMYGPPPLYLQRHRHQQMAGRRASLLNRKKKKGPVPHYDASAEASGNQTPRKHTDEDIGYGPSLTVPTKPGESSSIHPPAPPITENDGIVDNEVVPHDSNFIMAKRTDDGQHTIRRHGEVTLNPNKNTAYDGRYDKYIMTDSESETELPDHVNIACAAESAAVLAIGCVAGLRGLMKMKREKPSKGAKAAGGKDNLSSAWDDTRGKHGGSSAALDDPNLRGMSPEEFASHEEWDKGDWDGGKKEKESKKEKKKKRKSKNKASSEAPASPSDPEEPQSELLTAELHKMASASVSKNFGEQILSSALGARHSSMLNIASSAAGSRMSLNISSGEEDADDDFNAAISMVTGTPLKDKVKTQEPMDLSKIGVDKPVKDSKKTKEKVSKESEEAKKPEKQNKKDQKQREREDLKEKKLREQREKEELKEKKLREAKEREEQKAREKQQKIQEREQKQREAKEKAAREKEQAREKVAREKEQKLKEKEEQKAREKEQKLKEAQTKKERAEKRAAEIKAKRKSVETEASPQKIEKQKSTEAVKPQRKAPPPPAGKKGDGEPREVANKVTMFDTESESEPEDLNTNSNNNNNKGKSRSFEPTPKPAPPVSNPTSDGVDLIAADEQSLDIFGADGLAELNDALRELSNIQSSFTDTLEITTPPSKVTMATTQSQERREGQTMSGSASQHKTKKTTQKSTKSSSGAANRESRGVRGVGGAKGVATSTEVGVASKSTAMTQPSLTSTAVQGEGYQSSFEENVLRILQGLTDTMAQMRANPSITKTEIKQQEQLQQQMIQNLISYSENNPQLTTKLLTMVKREQSHDESASSRSAYELLEQKLLQAQEIQSRQAKDYFRTQEEFQASITRKLEEQAEQQLKLIQSNFEKYSMLLKEPKKKSRKKKHGDDGSSSDSDDGLVKPKKETQLAKPAVKTMQARIYRQDLLDDDSMRSSSQTSLTGKLKEKQLSRDKLLKRQETSLSFGHTQEAWKRFESVSSPIDEDDDDEMLSPQIVRPVTLKKADIRKIRDQAMEEELAVVKKAVQFNESEEQGQGQLRRIGSGKGIPQEKKMESFDIKYGNHVETNEHKKNVPAVDITIAGAAGELATILKTRQKIISH